MILSLWSKLCFEEKFIGPVSKCFGRYIHLEKISMNNMHDEKARQRELMAKKLPKRRKLKGIENIIIVASGKGGVGKSTTAVNLALSLAKIDAKIAVGLLDMDVFGPSIPRMMNLSGQPELNKDDDLVPLENYGIKCMSIGFLIEENAPIVWRGPMVMSAVQRLLLCTSWGSLKYLILDLPPGTGDTQLSISQLIQVTGAIIVSTPQDIALLDARKGAEMFKKVDIPVLGLVQNMSVFVCSNCGHREHIFGQDGVTRMASDMGVSMLGDIPLDVLIRKGSDHGQPIVVEQPDGVQSQSYLEIARIVKQKLESINSVKS